MYNRPYKPSTEMVKNLLKYATEFFLLPDATVTFKFSKGHQKQYGWAKLNKHYSYCKPSFMITLKVMHKWS